MVPGATESTSDARPSQTSLGQDAPWDVDRNCPQGFRASYQPAFVIDARYPISLCSHRIEGRLVYPPRQKAERGQLL